MLRIKIRCLVLLSLAVLAGCTTLQPVELEPEYTPAASSALLWHESGVASSKDWHVVLNKGPRALDWRLRAIDSATTSIELQTFLWHFDVSGSQVLDHLVRAADRGVAVRILVDDTFLVHEDELLLALAQHPMIEYRVFNPFKRRSGGLATRQLLNLAEFRRLDHRMHNKSMVVDNQLAIVGGRNLADEYFGLYQGANFRDLEFLLGGPIVREVSAAFDLYWNDRWSVPVDMLSHRNASREQLTEARSSVAAGVHAEESPEQRLERWRKLTAAANAGDARLFYDEPPIGNPKLQREAPIAVANALLELFDNATEEILIVSAYLIPTDDLEGAVQRALQRGVRVRILTNSIRSNNHLAAHSAYRNHINTLLEAGAEVHEVRVDAEDRRQYMLAPVDEKALALHAKALVIDGDKVFIGSANLDPRSLRINTEMGILVTSGDVNAEVRRALEGDLSAENAWQLQLQDDGRVFWVSSDEVLESQPAASGMQSIEDWFFSHLPIEGEM